MLPIKLSINIKELKRCTVCSLVTQNYIKIKIGAFREMAQWLTALVALVEDGSQFTAHTWWFTTLKLQIVRARGLGGLLRAYCLLGISEAIPMKSHQHDFPNTS